MRKSLLLPLVLPACAAVVEVGTPAPNPTPKVIGQGTDPTAEILIDRGSEAGLLTQVAATPAILLNGQSVGTCRFGRPIRLRLPAGNYTVTALTENGEENQWVVLEEGDSITLRCGVVATPNVTPKPRLERIEAD